MEQTPQVEVEDVGDMVLLLHMMNLLPFPPPQVRRVGLCDIAHVSSLPDHLQNTLLAFCLCISLFFLTSLGGCTSAVHGPQQATTSPSAALSANRLTTFPPSSSAAGTVTHSDGRDDLDRLSLLWQKRTQEKTASDYPIGPGDVLEISVPAMEELSNRTARVSGEGSISLPFIGVVQASGLTEEGLREEMRRRLEVYMYDSQVNLFVREYRSRQVAVIGAVTNPGLYSLASGADTILDMISLAGGMKVEAAPRIYFIPAEPVENEKVRELASTLPIQQVSAASSPLILKGADPLVIDLKSLTKGGRQVYLTLPTRPGDVILVPGGGDVLVEGWVEKPGSYKITPGLTVLGAVAAAGGSLFAADTSSVKIIQLGTEGEKIVFLVDLGEIKHGESPDVPVQDGDIIEVSSSTPKLISYSLYRFFSSVLNIGTSMPLY